MVAASGLLVVTLLMAAGQTLHPVGDPWLALLGLWAVLGVGYSAVLTPSGRLLRRSSGPEDRSALFAAQFALSHACWLVSYPLTGVLGQWGADAGRRGPGGDRRRIAAGR